jgi:hypothetical protein
MTPKRCHAYYYGGLPVKGARRKGRLWIKEDMICFEVPGGKAAEKIFLTRDNYYGAHPVLFDLTFRYGGENLYLQVCPNRGDSKKADCPSKKMV